MLRASHSPKFPSSDTQEIRPLQERPIITAPANDGELNTTSRVNTPTPSWTRMLPSRTRRAWRSR